MTLTRLYSAFGAPGIVSTPPGIHPAGAECETWELVDL